MGRILLQFGGVGTVLYLVLLLVTNAQSAAGGMVAQLQPAEVIAATKTMGVTLPYEIPGTALVVESLASYDGNFVEDGSERQVFNVACIVLRNTTDEDIAWIQVVLQSCNEQLVFTANTIPAHGMVMVLEKDAKQYAGDEIGACHGQVIFASEEWLDGRQLRFTDVDMGTVAVTNLTDSNIKKLRIYYKTYHADVDIFLGGVTYCTTIENLEAGGMALIEPSHYARGYSRIVRVSIE